MLSERVRVNQGIVRGCEEKLPNGKPFLRFSGIPYAKAPINELRFRPPQKLAKFDHDEIDCTLERDACFHKSTLSRNYVGSEDCLNLNVYVPSEAKCTEKLAVMIYIHGGALKYDSNSRQLYSPEYLLMENVIVVTINYRLHVLGFLTLPSMGISGNAGLKDQQMALEWVHENISSFNGDPDKICLFGESSGAASVHLQVLNQKSRKFIKSAICQSNTAINVINFQDQDEETARNLAKLLGCKSDSFSDVYDTLMSASAKDLYDNCDMFLSPKNQQAGNRNKWRFVIEEESDDAFITKTSVDSITSQAGDITIPMIFGTNDGDGMPVVARIISRKKLEVVNKNLSSLTLTLFRENSEKAAELAQAMRKFYFNGEDLSEKNIKSLVLLVTDTAFLFPQTIANDLNVRYHPKCKQFLYEFQFEGKLNMQKKQMKLDQIALSSHADDVCYLFSGELVDQVKLTEDSRESKMRKLMCKLWTNFAKYGDPTPDHDNPLSFKWNPIQAVRKNAKEVDYDYLVLSDNARMVKNLNKDRMDFWRDINRSWNAKQIKAKL